MRILFLAHRLPYPPNRGDRIRSFHLLRFLARRADVDLGFLAQEPVDEAAQAALGNLCRRVAWCDLQPRGRWLHGGWSFATGRSGTEGMFHSRRLRHILDGWSRDTRYDAVVVFCSSMAQYLSALRPGPTGAAPVIADLVDVDSQKWLDYAGQSRGLKRALYAREGARLRRLERSLAQRVAAVTLVSQAEAELFRSILRSAPGEPRAEGHVHAIPNGVDMEYFHPCWDSSQAPAATSAGSASCSVVFVGALDYRANVDGVQWFCEQVWPGLRRQVPDATFQIVGSNPGASVARLADLPGVQLIGQVPDVRPYLAGAAVAIAPLRVARGIQNKVLEALAMGKAVLASPQALEGLSLTAGVHAVQADTPEQWTTALAALLADASRRCHLGQAGRDYVERHHSWNSCLAALDDLLPGPAASFAPA